MELLTFENARVGMIIGQNIISNEKWRARITNITREKVDFVCTIDWRGNKRDDNSLQDYIYFSQEILILVEESQPKNCDHVIVLSNCFKYGMSPQQIYMKE